MLFNKPTDQLEFIAKDCHDAIQSLPYGPKTIEYYETGKACLNEIKRRQAIQWRRTDLRINMIDPLTTRAFNVRLPLITRIFNTRTFRVISNAEKRIFLNACFDYGSDKLQAKNKTN